MDEKRKRKANSHHAADGQVENVFSIYVEFLHKL